MIFKNKIYQLHQFLKHNKNTLFLAESCTGGLFAKSLTDLSGSSEYLTGSVVCYSNEIKRKILNVSDKTLSLYGAVSRQTVHEMILGLQRIADSDVQAAITGFAGPSGGTPDKPVGTVFIAVSDNQNIYIEECRFKGSRSSVRRQSVLKVIDSIFRLCSK